MGRETELTPERQDKIVNAIRAGAYVETAAQYSGISKQTFYVWLKRGNKEPGSIYEEFLWAIEKAMADAQMRDVLVIDRAAQGQPALLSDNGEVIQEAVKPDWKASAWRLERKFPKKWGRKQQVQLYPGEAPDEGDKSAFSEENLHSALMDLVEEQERIADGQVKLGPAEQIEEEDEIIDLDSIGDDSEDNEQDLEREMDDAVENLEDDDVDFDIIGLDEL